MSWAAAPRMIPVRRPFASRAISPPAGALVSGVMPASSNARVFARYTERSNLLTKTGWSGDTASMRERSGVNGPAPPPLEVAAPAEPAAQFS